jgi:hypothetical protein
MKNKKVLIAAISVSAIIIIGVIVYFFFVGKKENNYPNKQFSNRGNFSFDEEKVNATIKFFANAPSLDQAKTYCENDTAYCFYYCRQVNPNNEICSELNQSRPYGNRSRGKQ